MEIPIDYHLFFLTINVIFFLFTLLLLFIEPTVEKTTGAMILISINMVLCIICALSFAAVNFYGYDGTGTIVNNVNHDMFLPFGTIYFAFFYINFMLMIYAGYLFWKKPWEEHYAENKELYKDTSW